jgi:hypothetical protein
VPNCCCGKGYYEFVFLVDETFVHGLYVPCDGIDTRVQQEDILIIFIYSSNNGITGYIESVCGKHFSFFLFFGVLSRGTKMFANLRVLDSLCVWKFFAIILGARAVVSFGKLNAHIVWMVCWLN